MRQTLKVIKRFNVLSFWIIIDGRCSLYLLTINIKSVRKISNQKKYVDSTTMEHTNNVDNNTAYHFIIRFIDWHFRMKGKHD